MGLINLFLLKDKKYTIKNNKTYAKVFNKVSVDVNEILSIILSVEVK